MRRRKEVITVYMEGPDPDWTDEGPPEWVEYEEELPTKMEVCGGCRGNGTHVNRNIDGNGITSSEWAEWDEEEKDNYMSGAYDVTCEDCGGLRVVPTVDEDACTPEQLKAWIDHCNGERAYEAECAAERRMMGGEW